MYLILINVMFINHSNFTQFFFFYEIIRKKYSFFTVQYPADLDFFLQKIPH